MAILEELNMDEDVQIYRCEQVLENDEEIGEMTDGEAIIARIERGGGGSEALSAKVKGASTDLWLVSGNNWKFRMVHIPSGSLVPVEIKANTFTKPLKQEHKFALVRKKPEDGIWRGRRYKLEEAEATIELEDDRAGWFTVKAVFQAGETRREYKLIPGPEKTYDEGEMSDREKRINLALGVMGCVATVVGLFLA